MRIGVDLFSIVPATGRGGGFHRYTTELMNALRDLGKADHYFLFTNSLNSSMFPRDRGMTQVVVPLPPQRQVWPFRLAWQHGLLPVPGTQLQARLDAFSDRYRGALAGRSVCRDDQ